jgi:hypothetical protein
VLNTFCKTFELLRLSIFALFQRGDKRRATEEPENIGELKPKKIIRNTLRQPCVAHNFNRCVKWSDTIHILHGETQNNMVEFWVSFISNWCFYCCSIHLSFI